MIFWIVRLILMFAAALALLFEWRQGVVIAYALVVDFLCLVGLLLPGFGLAAEFLMVLLMSLLIGMVLILGKERRRAPLFVCVLALVVLHLSLYGDALLKQEAQAGNFVHGLAALGVLVLAVGLGFEAAFQVRRLLAAVITRTKRGARNAPI